MQKIGDRRATATRRGNRFLSVRTQRTSARGREDGFGGRDYRGWVCGGDEQEDEETGGEDDGGGAGAGESSRDFGAGCCGAGGAGRGGGGGTTNDGGSSGIVSGFSGWCGIRKSDRGITSDGFSERSVRGGVESGV